MTRPREPSTSESVARVLAEAADHLYEVCELYEDDDLDPADHLKVVRRAYTTSHCDDFSYMVHQMTGWPCVTAVLIRCESGRDPLGHHSLNRAPDGRLFDVGGYIDEAGLARRYLGHKGLAAGHKVVLQGAQPRPMTVFDDVDEQGIESCMTRIAAIIRVLPYAPFATERFRVLAARPVPGVDVPLPDFDQEVETEEVSHALG